MEAGAGDASAQRVPVELPKESASKFRVVLRHRPGGHSAHLLSRAEELELTVTFTGRVHKLLSFYPLPKREYSKRLCLPWRRADLSGLSADSPLIFTQPECDLSQGVSP
jgi:hypothetical protein